MGLESYCIYLAPIAPINNYGKPANFITHANPNNIDFVGKINKESITFGVRNNPVTTNRLRGSYLVKNNLSFDVQLRHYWSRVEQQDNFMI